MGRKKQMIIRETPLKGAYLIKPEPFRDDRGAFARIFCQRELAEAGLDMKIVQANRSINRKAGCLRGLHYQLPPKAEIKLISCTKGSILDVIVDIRKDSPTFLKWFSKTLTAENMFLVYAPEGFAHGFQTLENDSELVYLTSEFYTPEHEAGIRHNDPMLSIDWPLSPTDMSKRDCDHPLLTKEFKGI